MEIVIGIWIIPFFLTIAIWAWIYWGFDYQGSGYFPSVTWIFTLPLGGFLTCLVWMIYFAIMYFTKE
jgi:glycopeptide antibiotics resistance protein